MNTTVIVKDSLNILLKFLNMRGSCGGSCVGAFGPMLIILSYIPQNKPRITLLFQLVVIVFKHSVKVLVFLNVRGWTKGGRRPPDKPLLYPPEQTSNNFVVSIGCHRVQTFCEGLGFPKCERFRGIWYFVKQIILFISYIAKVAIL